MLDREGPERHARVSDLPCLLHPGDLLVLNDTRVIPARLFGQSGEYGLEIEADCMARVQGATWTNYTSCSNAAWRSYATKLVHRTKP